MTLLVAALVSVGVSTFVTLAIELFAKPAIETRKERILARARIKREVSADAIVSWHKFDLTQFPLELSDPEAYDRVRSTVGEAQYLLTNRIDREATYAITQGVLYAGITRRPRALAESREAINQAVDLLNSSKWRVSKRKKDLRDLNSRMADLRTLLSEEFPDYYL